MSEPKRNAQNKITILCGHYGCGKTNLSLNLALESAGHGKKTALLDMDIVNPYFRSSEYGKLLSENGVRLIAPSFAGSTLDTPVLPPEIYSVFDGSGETVFIDAGGDDAGITALGGLSEKINTSGYGMLYVINQNRVLSQSPEEALTLLYEIERASRLKATAVVNNTHLGVETTYETVLRSVDFAEQTADLAGLPLLYTTIPDFSVPADGALPPGFKVIRRLVLFPWEQENAEALPRA